LQQEKAFMASLVAAIPAVEHCALFIEIAGTSPGQAWRWRPVLPL